MKNRFENWCDAWSLDVGEQARWRIGALTLRGARDASEWRFSIDYGDDPLQDGVDIEVPCVAPVAEGAGLSSASVRRFGATGAHEQVRLAPMLADRAYITRPESVFAIPPQGRVTAYISSPIWVQVFVGDSDTALGAFPVFRPSDTWFGPTTAGELGYAGRTFLRTNLRDVQLRAHRAMTRVDLINSGVTPLVIERLRVPLPNLCLYRTEMGMFWTEDTTLTREGDDDLARLTVRDGPPTDHLDAVRVAEPHAKNSNIVVRAFSSLFNNGEGV